MTIHYSVESLQDLFLSDEYISDKNEYNKKRQPIVTKLQSFLNSLEINKNYYRTGVRVKNPKYKKKASGDTLLIKDFKASLNKMSSINYKNICTNLVASVSHKNHLYPLLIQYIVEQSLLHHTYIKFYVELISQLHDNFKDVSMIEQQLDECYKMITMSTIDTASSDYSNLCSKNKQVDQLVGYGILISELEVKQIITNRIDESIQSILEKMKHELSEDETYKCILCLSTIFKVLYSDKPIQEDYVSILTDIKDSMKFMKIKFKIMDILEKR